jgi:hypothetical protein
VSAPDPIRRLREIAAESADHAILADGPVTPDAALLDLCAEALHLLSQAEKAEKTVRQLPHYGSRDFTEQTRAEHERFWAEIAALRQQAKPVMYRIRKIPAKTGAGIYAKALVVRSSVTGAAILARTLAADLVECRELRESLWPMKAESDRRPAR